MQSGSVNVYECNACHKRIATVDLADGTTPFTIGCMTNDKSLVDRVAGIRVKYKTECNGMMQSCWYGQLPGGYGEPMPEVTYEWYKPTVEEACKLEDGEREHVSLGGLLLREITDEGRALLKNRNEKVNTEYNS